MEVEDFFLYRNKYVSIQTTHTYTSNPGERPGVDYADYFLALKSGSLIQYCEVVLFRSLALAFRSVPFRSVSFCPAPLCQVTPPPRTKRQGGEPISVSAAEDESTERPSAFYLDERRVELNKK
jgi:hypothetical protein